MGIIQCSPAATPTGTQANPGNRAPLVKSAKILPEPIVLTSPLTVLVEAEDPEREAVSFRYRWFVNGTQVSGQTGASLPPDALTRGQQVTVEIVPSDGTHEGAPYRTAVATVGNSPPIVTRVSVTPESPEAGERLTAQVEIRDPDGDPLSVSYRWYRNAVLVKETDEPFFETAGSAGGMIVLEVEARDLSAAGNPVRSNAIVVRNAPPRIVSMPPTAAQSERYEYKVKAEDRDGDTVTYQLEKGPPGMTIESGTGRLLWAFPADQRGTVPVRITASDGQGGTAIQEFEIVLTSNKPSGT
jgi:hypothetical protein